MLEYDTTYKAFIKLLIALLSCSTQNGYCSSV